MAFSYDEEVGCTGVRPMIAELGKTPAACRASVFVGEPTEHGRGRRPQRTGALARRVDGAGGALEHAALWGQCHRLRRPPAGRAVADGETSSRPADQDPRFDPPFTTLQVTQIEGGTASNVVPVPCWFGWEIRALAGLRSDARWIARLKAFAAEQCLPEMRRLAPEAGDHDRGHQPGAGLCGRYGVGDRSAHPEAGRARTKRCAVSYCTEAGLFQDGGAPAIVCGPGNIAQAHTANEFLSLDELEKCLLFLGRLAD